MPSIPHALNQLREFHEAIHAKAIAAGLSAVADYCAPDMHFDRTNYRNHLRAALIREEATELDDELLAGDEAAAMKEMCDLLYVIYGSAVTFGWSNQLTAAFNRVHDNNMAKVRHGEFNKSGKLCKPANHPTVDLGDLIDG
jgi:predicted HAD superfamily Cof-like phosphohydrolase